MSVITHTLTENNHAGEHIHLVKFHEKEVKALFVVKGEGGRRSNVTLLD